MDPQNRDVPPPFDAVPPPDDGPETAQPAPAGRPRLVRTASFAAFLAAAGFGQGFALVLLFGGGDDRLREETPAVVTPPAAAAVAVVEEPVEAVGPRHELDIARERFRMGDLEGARRTAAAFLLRQDGLDAADARRVSSAYTLLGDVLREGYERSLTPPEEP